MGALLGNTGPNFLSGGIDAATQPVVLPPLGVITQADVDRLTLALSQPERQVTLGGQTITYRSTADLLLARDTLQAQLNAQLAARAGLGKRPRRVYAVYGGRGYNNGYGE